MNMSSLVLILMNAAHKIESEVVCNDDFDGNDDVLEAIEDIRQVATELRTLTGVDSKARMKRAEHDRYIDDIMRINNSNKEFQYFFAYTAYADDDIHAMGGSDYIFDTHVGIEMLRRAARCIKNPEELVHLLRHAIMEDDDD